MDRSETPQGHATTASCWWFREDDADNRSSGTSRIINPVPSTSPARTLSPFFRIGCEQCLQSEKDGARAGIQLFERKAVLDHVAGKPRISLLVVDPRQVRTGISVAGFELDAAFQVSLGVVEVSRPQMARGEQAVAFGIIRIQLDELRERRSGGRCCVIWRDSLSALLLSDAPNR